MKIILASPRGFCAGVNMAIDTLDQAINLFGAPVYVYHEIVHNKHVVERFQGQGAVFVNDLNEVPDRFAPAFFRTWRIARSAAASPASAD